MPNITLPDGKKINFKSKINGLEIADKISKSLIKQALIMSVDGELKDLSYSIKRDSTVKIITHKDRKNDKIQSLKSHNIQKCITWCINNKIPYNKNYPTNNIFLGFANGLSGYP